MNGFPSSSNEMGDTCLIPSLSPDKCWCLENTECKSGETGATNWSFEDQMKADPPGSEWTSIACVEKPRATAL